MIYTQRGDTSLQYFHHFIFIGGVYMAKTDSGNVEHAKKKKFQLPHIYVILFVFSAIAAITTYIIPAGAFEGAPGPEGRTTLDPHSFQHVGHTMVGIFDCRTVIARGLIDAGEVVFFSAISGGMCMVLRRTGIIEVVVDNLARKFSTRSMLVIPVRMT